MSIIYIYAYTCIHMSKYASSINIMDCSRSRQLKEHYDVRPKKSAWWLFIIKEKQFVAKFWGANLASVLFKLPFASLGVRTNASVKIADKCTRRMANWESVMLLCISLSCHFHHYIFHTGCMGRMVFRAEVNFFGAVGNGIGAEEWFPHRSHREGQV